MAKAIALTTIMAPYSSTQIPPNLAPSVNWKPLSIPQYSYPLDMLLRRLRKENLLAEHTLAVYTPLVHL